MARPDDAVDPGARLLAAAAIPVLLIVGVLWAYFGLFAQDPCAYNDSGRACDPGPWAGRSMAFVGSLLRALTLLTLTCLALRVAAGHRTADVLKPAATTFMACLGLCVSGLLVLAYAKA